jgi:translation initiation factor 2 alpha subunit (eIF-2alpha)
MESLEFKISREPDTELISKINERASSASDKIKTWVENFALEELGSLAKSQLKRMKPDYTEIVNDPDNSTWGDAYKGFTPEEIKELYFVLYGEKLDEEK